MGRVVAITSFSPPLAITKEHPNSQGLHRIDLTLTSRVGSDGHKPVSRSHPPIPLLGSNQVKGGQPDLILECFAYRFPLFLVGYDQESIQSYKFLDSDQGGNNIKKAELINADRESRSSLSSGLLDPALSETRGPGLLS